MSDLEYHLVDRKDASYFVDAEATFHFPVASMKRVNQIRRTILTRLDTVAIDLAYVMVNTSSQHDDTITHRLGLVPLVQPAPEDPGPWTFWLHVRAPASEPLRVMSGHLAAQGHSVHPLYETIEIVKLYPGEEVKMAVLAKRAPGSYHAKHIAAHAFHKPGKAGGVDLVIRSANDIDP